MARKLLTIITLAAALCAGAQTSQIATLLHDGQLTNFYSGSALIQAYEAAVDGDVITLSSGMFNATDIKKNITIRGAGMGLVEAGDTTLPTVINGKFIIECPTVPIHRLIMEGIATNGEINLNKADNMMAQKCQFDRIYSYYYSSTPNNEIKNITFLQCYIKLYTQSSHSSLNFINCVIGETNTHSDTTFSCGFHNCQIGTGTERIYFSNSEISNSIILGPTNNVKPDIYKSSSVNNCLIFNYSYDYSNGSNKFVESPEEIFAEEGYYQLTDEAKAFLGTDGKEVGIYGGTLPFDTTPSNPQITKFNVSPKTTADGKLSVDIEVHGVE